VHPSEVGFIAEQPFLKCLGVRHGREILVGLVGGTLAHLVRLRFHIEQARLRLLLKLLLLLMMVTEDH